MPQNQDPYGSHAYRQRIFKEMQSAINFRQIQRCGGFHAPPYATTGDPFFLRETLPATNRFTLRAPYAYVDREGKSLPVVATQKAVLPEPFPVVAVAANPVAAPIPSSSPLTTEEERPAPAAVVAQPLTAVSSPLQGADTASISSTKPQLGRPTKERAKSAAVLRSKVLSQREQQQVPPPAVTGSAALPPAKVPTGRCLSAAVQRPPLAQGGAVKSLNNNTGTLPLQKAPLVRASSASVRSSGAVSASSSIDPLVASKVVLLEKTLQEERETRMRLCSQLSQLEALLARNASVSAKKSM